jgi:hypothetical protein
MPERAPCSAPKAFALAVPTAARRRSAYDSPPAAMAVSAQPWPLFLRASSLPTLPATVVPTFLRGWT